MDLITQKDVYKEIIRVSPTNYFVKDIIIFLDNIFENIEAMQSETRKEGIHLFWNNTIR